MAASKSKTLAFLESESEDVSDSDTDYEPEPKKSKLEESRVEEKEADGRIAIPFRGTTTAVFEVSNEETGGPVRRYRLTNRNCPEEGGPSEGLSNQSDSSMTVGSLVQRTIEASISSFLSSPPSQSEINSQGDEDLFAPGPGPRTPSGSNRGGVDEMAGEFNTIAREVVGSASSTRVSSGESGGSRLRRVSAGQQLATFAIRRWEPSDRRAGSRSSSEYFTDDVDPQEIPSDEYLSPPIQLRQRRNAIFARREPPPVPENEDDQFYHNELEVASAFDANENPIEDGSSTSDPEDEVFSRSFTPMEPPPPEETDTNFADNEIRTDGESQPAQLLSSDSQEPGTSDKALPDPNNKMLCSQCHAPKAKACFRYCLRCFKIRRTWLPPRPASRRLKTRKALMRSNPNSLNNSVNSTQTRSTDSSGDDVVDGRPPQSQIVSSNPTSTIQHNLPTTERLEMNNGFIVDEDNTGLDRLSPATPPGNVTLMRLFASPPVSRNAGRSRLATASTDVDSQSQSLSGSSQSQRSIFSMGSSQGLGTSTQSSTSPSQPQIEVSPPSSSNTNDVLPSLSSPCSICYVRDKDAAFVHNKIAHLYCCYSCADKILKKNGKCPICRERVLRVVKIISV